jgi:hypothetical protein
MGIYSDTRRQAIAAIFVTITLLCFAETASAGARLYTGSIQIKLMSSFGFSYPLVIGAGFEYPNMDNLPSGDLATTQGNAPVAIRIPPNQMTLKTSLSTFSPPPSWPQTWVYTKFSGANGAGSFSPGGAPGSATSAPVTSASGSLFGVSFSGTPTQFGGTMRVLGNFTAQVGYWWSSKIPIEAIGGSFGGKRTATGYQGGGTASSPTFFTSSVWGFPWTTGTVTAMAPPYRYPGGIGPSVNLLTGHTPTTVRLTEKGADMRTPKGNGDLQLVSPFVVRKREQTTGALLVARAGVAIVTLRFVPEPLAIAQFAAGVSGLSLIYFFSHRKKS